MPGPTTPHPSRTPRGPGSAVPPVARMARRDAARPAAVPAAERDHATEVVAHVLHRECAQWSWTTHGAGAHREQASSIVGALCQEGWGPARSAA